MTEYLPKLNNIIKNFKYKFVNNDLLKLALTHSSNKDHSYNNQRLEFLGDAILNFVIAEHLYQSQPNIPEGGLTRIRSYLVKEDTLAAVAKKLLVQKYIILGLGEQKTGGFNKNSIFFVSITEGVSRVDFKVFIFPKMLFSNRIYFFIVSSFPIIIFN